MKIIASVYFQRTDGTPPSQLKKSARTQHSVDAVKATRLADIPFMELEEMESQTRTSAQDVNSYKMTCGEIQKLVSEIHQFKSRGDCHNVRNCNFCF